MLCSEAFTAAALTIRVGLLCQCPVQHYVSCLDATEVTHERMRRVTMRLNGIFTARCINHGKITAKTRHQITGTKTIIYYSL